MLETPHLAPQIAMLVYRQISSHFNYTFNPKLDHLNHHSSFALNHQFHNNAHGNHHLTYQ